MILLTHEGPAEWGTSQGHDMNGFYSSGSSTLNNLLEEIQGNCVAAIHGHNHLGAFSDHMRHMDIVEFPVLNPSSLSLGEYGYLQLIQDTKKDHEDKEHKYWRAAEASKRYLASLNFAEI